jgi:cytoskeletal protein CcmA (bactofilin family)
MRMSLADRPLRAPALAAALLLASAGGATVALAQDPGDVLSKTVSVGRQSAALELEFVDRTPLAIALTDGEVTIDGEVVGSFSTGGALDAAWRSLLGFAVSLDDGALARALIDWSPPEGLSGESLDVAARIDTSLEEALRGDGSSRAASPGDSESSALRSLVSLLDRTEALAGLAEALGGLDLDEVRLSVGEDLFIGEGEVVEATVLVVDADLEVAGRVRGDVVVIDGDIRLAPTGRIDGDVRYSDGTVIDQGARVEGDVVRVTPAEIAIERRVRDEVRSELQREIRSEVREATRGRRGESFFGRVFGGLGGAIAQLFMVLVLGIIGAIVTHFAAPNLDAVAETARRTPGRALTVGTAGAFLILPAFVLGIVALAISIIGIPALILWIPLFPVAVVLGGGLGYLAVARNVGVWVSRQRFPYMAWVRISNPVTLMAGGALALASPIIAAELVSVFPWTGALEVLLRVTGYMLGMIATLMGFGSVLLTRAGRRPEFFDDDVFGTTDPRRRPAPATEVWDDAMADARSAASASDGAETVDTPPASEEPRDTEVEADVETDADANDGADDGTPQDHDPPHA